MARTHDANGRAPEAVQTPSTRQCGDCVEPRRGRTSKKYWDAKCWTMAHRVRTVDKAKEILRRLKDYIAELEGQE